MASKDTKRERREEAKKARLEAQRRAKRKAATRKVYSGVVVVGIIGVIAFLISNSGKAGRQAAAGFLANATAAGCEAPKDVDELPSAKHITPPAKATYNSNPPTSGEHYVGPANSAGYSGVHTNAFEDELQVHNLEHGHMGIQYKETLPDAVRTALEEWTTKNETKAFMAPRPALEQMVAFTAWGKLMTCGSITDPALATKVADGFLSVHGDKGPESVPGIAQK